jgi:arabinose-5-phosphate isomerase
LTDPPVCGKLMALLPTAAPTRFRSAAPVPQRTETVRPAHNAKRRSSSTRGDSSRSRQILQRGRRILQLEADAVAGLAGLIDQSFVQAVEKIAGCAGKIVVTGIGKAGLVGQKTAATFSSTGTPAIFLHPADAVHGDLGMVEGRDVVLALSNSGRSQELQRILPLLRDLGCQIILVTGDADSACARLSHVILSIGKIIEACPLGLAPSSSTTAILAMGDALALTVLQEKEFHQERYAMLHPAGSLGRRLMKVGQIIRRDERCPRISFTGSVLDAIEAITQTPGRAGATCVVTDEGKLVGFFTDGDLRRLVNSDRFKHPRDIPIAEVMTRNPKTAQESDYVVQAVVTLRRYKIDELPVVTPEGVLVGVLDVQDLLVAGFEDVDRDR